MSPDRGAPFLLLKPFVKSVFFIASYIPLFVIFIIQNIEKYAIDAVFAGLIVISILTLSYVFSNIKQIDGEFRTIDEIESLNRVNLEYFVAYIIPFLGIDLNSLTNVISLLFLFVIMGFMYVRSDSIYLNPVFAVFGLNVFRVRSKDEE